MLEVLKNQELWGADLTALPGFAAAVQKQLKEIRSIGVLNALNVLELKKISA